MYLVHTCISNVNKLLVSWWCGRRFSQMFWSFMHLRWKYLCPCRCVVWTGDDRVFFFNPTMQLSVWERPVDLKDRGDLKRIMEDPPHKRKKDSSSMTLALTNTLSPPCQPSTEHFATPHFINAIILTISEYLWKAYIHCKLLSLHRTTMQIHKSFQQLTKYSYRLANQNLSCVTGFVNIELQGDLVRKLLCAWLDFPEGCSSLLI